MKQDREFNRILDECLERLLQGDTPEQCLQQYPEQTAELEPLLRTASAVKEASAITPDPIFRARAREEFHTALQEMEAKRGFSFLGLRSWVATAVTVLLAVVVLSSSTVVAAGNSMPGQPLYPVKLATEQVQITFTFSELGKAELYANLADKRVNEIVYAAGKGDIQQVELGALRLGTYLNKAAVLVGAPAEAVQVASVPTAQPAPMLSAPAPTPAPVPAAEAPRVMMAPAVPPENAADKGFATSESAPSVAVTAPAPQAAMGSGEATVVANDKRSVLNIAVKNKSVENIERLKAVLATAPESARPALEKAIKQAEASYQKVIDATEQPLSGNMEAESNTAVSNPARTVIANEAQNNSPVTGEKGVQGVTAESAPKTELNKSSTAVKENSTDNVSPSNQVNGQTNRVKEKQKVRNQ